MTNRDTNVPKSDNKLENVVIIRGGGDLASGTIHRLYRCGYRLLVLECEKPTAIRRMVSFCEAVYDRQSSVEGVLCRKVDSVEECEAVWKAGEIPLMADTEGTVLKKYRPAALIDAILAKKNLGTTREMADLTVGLGPGFVAGEDVDYVVETMRGHNLARIITKALLCQTQEFRVSLEDLEKSACFMLLLQGKSIVSQRLQISWRRIRSLPGSEIHLSGLLLQEFCVA